MIDGLSVLALIPARAGSKRLPAKNVRPFGGAPMIAWSVRAARESVFVDQIVVSSDDPAAVEAAVAEGAVAPFVRPAALSTDQTSTADVVVHALRMTAPRPDLVVLLQPTSPLRRGDDIDATLKQLVATGASAALTTSPLGKPLSWLLRQAADGRLGKLLDPSTPVANDEACFPNGAVYVVRAERFLAEPDFYPADLVGVSMPPERSVDIDTLADLRLAEAMLEFSIRQYQI